MFPAPSATGLFLCRRVDFNNTTRSFSLMDCFWRLEVPSMPGTAPPFVAFAALRGGIGTGTVQLAAYRMDTGNLVYATARPIAFPDRLTAVYVPIRIGHFQPPVAGEYEFDLIVDHEIVAQQSLYVEVGGNQP